MEALPDRHYRCQPAASKTTDAFEAELLIGCCLTLFDFQLACHLVENLQEQVALSRRVEQRTPAITAARDEVQMAVAVSAFEAILHRQGRAPFANPAKDAAPASSSVRAEAEKNRSDLDPAKLALKAADLYFDR